jgi:2-polyprenyl-3-methyl-5-hydroxy-6-metoxy-1,4-benzoquinol methylase
MSMYLSVRVDKAGRHFWDTSWASRDVARAINPSERQLRNRVNQKFHQYFVDLFDGMDTRSMKLLEVGCGNSAWLPYFSRQFGFRVSGIDYSLIGCELARQVLKSNGIDGEISCADIFSPPRHLVGAFNVVVSFGVVEHFDDTASCLKAVRTFLLPGGLMSTSVPNMCGIIGAIQKKVNRPVYETHRLIRPHILRAEHEKAGLDVVDCRYFLSTNFGVCNLKGVPASTPTGLFKRACLALLSRMSMLAWWIEGRFGDFRVSELFSPYINCVARKRPLPPQGGLG